jgi:hypothetical protein
VTGVFHDTFVWVIELTDTERKQVLNFATRKYEVQAAQHEEHIELQIEFPQKSIAATSHSSWRLSVSLLCEQTNTLLSIQNGAEITNTSWDEGGLPGPGDERMDDHIQFGISGTSTRSRNHMSITSYLHGIARNLTRLDDPLNGHADASELLRLNAVAASPAGLAKDQRRRLELLTCMQEAAGTTATHELGMFPDVCLLKYKYMAIEFDVDRNDFELYIDAQDKDRILQFLWSELERPNIPF